MKNRSRIALMVGALFLLGTGSITAYQSMSNTIAIVDDGKVTQYETLDLYVGDVLENQEIVLGEQDTIMPSVGTKVEDGTKIIIHRWKPTVHVTHNGVTTTFRTDEKTVGDVLKLRNITLTEGSECSQPVDTEVTDRMAIDIKTREVVTEVIQQEIPFETQVEYTKDLKPDEEKVVTEGKPGVKESIVEIVQFGGEVIAETTKNEEVIMEPQAKVVQQGIKNAIVDPETGKVYEYTKALTLEATAYTDIPGDRWEGITATGRPTFLGMVAVDPKVIPLNTVLYVEGYGIAIAGDTGGAIKGHDIDLFFETSKEVYSFGRRQKEVYILKDQSIDVQKERKNN
ncbi:MAG: 3D domain-containing protein [Cellulosilyticaceae bacterium]